MQVISGSAKIFFWRSVFWPTLVWETQNSRILFDQKGAQVRNDVSYPDCKRSESGSFIQRIRFRLFVFLRDDWNIDLAAGVEF